jgi:hypothetical protein
MSTTPHTLAQDNAINPAHLEQHAHFLREQALANGWLVSQLRSAADGHLGFVATDIPRGVEIHTELTPDGGLRSWRLEHRTQTKISDQVVAWFEHH